MYMTAERLIRDGKPLLKLNIHEYHETDIPFLDSLGIRESDDTSESCRYLHIHSQDFFREIRAQIIEKYDVLEEKGPRVYLRAKT